MGWSFSTQWRGRAELVRHLRRSDRFDDKWHLVRACTSGNHHWYLMQERATGMHWIGLDLLQSGGPGNGWGYKDLDESVGPSAVDCPLTYLAAPHGEPVGHAAQWRERVRAYHAGRQARPAPAPGVWVKYGGRAYRLIEPVGPRRGWRVADELGDTYRMQARQLSQAAPCENPGAARQAMAA
jgi:hypothetical protein